MTYQTGTIRQTSDRKPAAGSRQEPYKRNRQEICSRKQTGTIQQTTDRKHAAGIADNRPVLLRYTKAMSAPWGENYTFYVQAINMFFHC